MFLLMGSWWPILYASPTLNNRHIFIHRPGQQTKIDVFLRLSGETGVTRCSLISRLIIIIIIIIILLLLLLSLLQYTSSVVSTIHLTEWIVAQIHNPPDAEDVRPSISHSRKEKNAQLTTKSAAVENYLPESTKRDGERRIELADCHSNKRSWLRPK